MFFHLNHVNIVVDQLAIIENDYIFFAWIMSNDDVIMSTLKNKLQL
jgi:hypothetical protein